MVYVSERQPGIRTGLQLLLPRLKAFAVALCGGEQASQALLRITCRHILAQAGLERGRTLFEIWAFTQMHTLWASRMAPHARAREGAPADARLFLGNARYAPPSPALLNLSKFIAYLPPQQRGTLLLAYGEGLAYDEVAEVFGVPVATVMTRLVRAHNALAYWLEHSGAPAAPRPAPAQQQPHWQPAHILDTPPGWDPASNSFARERAA